MVQDNGRGSMSAYLRQNLSQKESIALPYMDHVTESS